MENGPGGDAILIEQLEISARIGITAEERANPQRLTFILTLWPHHGFAGVGDRIEKTVDYSAVRNRVEEVAEARPRHLIETLAEDTASALLEEFPLAAVLVELRKYVLPEARYAGVRILRRAK